MPHDDLPDASPYVLIVEDDEESAAVFREIVRGHPYVARVVSNAERALTELDAATPVGMVIDLHLPTMDGRELLRRVRADARFAAVPAAIITGDYLTDETCASDIESLGATLHFKPLWDEDLMAILGRF
jgi:two-component system CheB/CheR fusion protein